jgi:hypothetical protein
LKFLFSNKSQIITNETKKSSLQEKEKRKAFERLYIVVEYLSIQRKMASTIEQVETSILPPPMENPITDLESENMAVESTPELAETSSVNRKKRALTEADTTILEGEKSSAEEIKDSPEKIQKISTEETPKEEVQKEQEDESPERTDPKDVEKEEVSQTPPESQTE